MAFPQSVIEQAYKLSGHKCQCSRKTCGHKGPCYEPLDEGNWHARYKIPAIGGGTDTVSNCEILCTPCYKNAQTSGG